MRWPPLLPVLSDRLAALRSKAGPLTWMYALVPVPLVTDWIENGALPTTLRGWLTEVVGGIVIAALVLRVRRDRRALEALARCDGLTGLLNRRVFAVSVDAECARAQRAGSELSLVYLDVDRFKEVNDRFGHAAGDQVLGQLASAILETVRARVDIAFRLGGDEFALLLAGSNEAQAAEVVERIRAACAMHDVRWAVGAFGFSAGVVERSAGERPESLVARGDAAMYRHKAARHASADPSLGGPAASG